MDVEGDHRNIDLIAAQLDHLDVRARDDDGIADRQAIKRHDTGDALIGTGRLVEKGRDILLLRRARVEQADLDKQVARRSASRIEHLQVEMDDQRVARRRRRAR